MSIIKTRQANQWHHLWAYFCSEWGIMPRGGGGPYWRWWGSIHMPHWMQTSTTRWLHGCVSSFNNRSLWLNEQQFYLFGQIQTSQPGGQPYSYTSPYGECSLAKSYLDESFGSTSSTEDWIITPERSWEIRLSFFPMARRLSLGWAPHKIIPPERERLEEARACEKYFHIGRYLSYVIKGSEW